MVLYVPIDVMDNRLFQWWLPHKAMVRMDNRYYNKYCIGIVTQFVIEIRPLGK